MFESYFVGHFTQRSRLPLKDQVGEPVVEHLNDTIIKDLLIPVLLLLLKLLDDRLHIVGIVLSEGSRRLRSIRRHFEDTGIYP